MRKIVEKEVVAGAENERWSGGARAADEDGRGANTEGEDGRGTNTEDEDGWLGPIQKVKMGVARGEDERWAWQEGKMKDGRGTNTEGEDGRGKSGR